MSDIESKAELRAEVARLRAALEVLVSMQQHSGACCTFDDAKRVVVTTASCRCGPELKQARAALGESK